MTRTRRWRLGACAVVIASTAAGCHEELDPLDPEVLAEVSRTRGDAQGIERSGIYVGEFDVLECGCGDIEANSAYNISLCSAIEQLEGFGLPPVLQLELVQADGSVRIQALGVSDFFESEASLLPAFYGPLQADGRFSAGGVLELDALVAQGSVLGRIDGTTELEPEGWTLDGEYQQRYALELAIQSDVLDFGGEDEVPLQSVDCRERIALDLLWVSPPFGPVVGR